MAAGVSEAAATRRGHLVDGNRHLASWKESKYEEHLSHLQAQNVRGENTAPAPAPRVSENILYCLVTKKVISGFPRVFQKSQHILWQWDYKNRPQLHVFLFYIRKAILCWNAWMSGAGEKNTEIRVVTFFYSHRIHVGSIYLHFPLNVAIFHLM